MELAKAPAEDTPGKAMNVANRRRGVHRMRLRLLRKEATPRWRRRLLMLLLLRKEVGHKKAEHRMRIRLLRSHQHPLWGTSGKGGLPSR